MKGRRSLLLNVSITERVTVTIRLLTRLKNRDQLLRALILLEYWESLKAEFKFLKYYFSSFYSKWEFRLLEDLSLQTQGKSKKKYNRRLVFLWENGLLPGPYTKQDLISQIADLEFEFQERATKGHNTRYGYIKHFRDHGHLPPDKPDYSLDVDELEENFLILQEEEERIIKIRNFLLTEGKTNFEELFPSFRQVSSSTKEEP